MSEENRVSIYDYKPEHFGDTILEGVIVRDIKTVVHHEYMVPVGVTWSWKSDQSTSTWLGPWSDERQQIVLAPPPTRSEIMADIAALIRLLLTEGALRVDAFDEVA